MARKRRLASSARGLLCFCFMAQIGVQEVQGVQKVQIRSIRLIRGRERRTCSAAYCPPGSICDMLSIPRALPPVTQGSAFQAPECLWILMMRYPPGTRALARYYDETDNI